MFRFSGHTICVIAAAGVGVIDGVRVKERVVVGVRVDERVSVGERVGLGGGG